MRRLFTLAAVLAIASAGFLPPAPTLAQAVPTGEPTPPPKQQCSAKKSKWQQKQCQDYNNSAPGDEYFGKLKMSYLGINNTFKDMVIESGEFTTSQQIINKLNFAVEALAKWSAKYPHDPDLARSYYLGVLALRKVYVQAQQQLAWQYIQTILKHFPNTYFSKQMALATKDGFTEHWYTDAQPCPVAGADPPASPTPAPPSKPGQPVVDLIAPPCIAPPTPEPGFQPSATPSPAPRGRNAPAPAVTNPPATAAPSTPAPERLSPPSATPSPATSASPSPAASASPKALAAARKTKPAAQVSGSPAPGPWPPPPH